MGFPRPGFGWTDWHRSHTPAVARVEGVGPVDLATLRRWLGDAHITVRPVIDLNVIPAVDAYEVPARLRQILCARNPVEVFPYSNRPATSRFVDLDHTIPFDHQAEPGALQTRIENLGPLARGPHRAKTAKAWTVTQPEPGEYLFTSKYGYRYHVDEHGTTALGRLPDARNARPYGPERLPRASTGSASNTSTGSASNTSTGSASNTSTGSAGGTASITSVRPPLPVYEPAPF